MSMNCFECIICYNDFNSTTRRPCIGTCGHSICEPCKGQMMSSKCPQCNREEAFANNTVNYQAAELLKKLPEGHGCCSECSFHSPLRVCVTCTSDTLFHIVEEKKYIIRVENGDIYSAICAVKSKAICADCALDGLQHEGHKTIRLDDLIENTMNCAERIGEDRIEPTAVSRQVPSTSQHSQAESDNRNRNNSNVVGLNGREDHHLKPLSSIFDEKGMCFKCGRYSNALRVCATCLVNFGYLRSKQEGIYCWNDDIQTPVLPFAFLCWDCSHGGHVEDHKIVGVGVLKKMVDSNKEVLIDMEAWGKRIKSMVEKLRQKFEDSGEAIQSTLQDTDMFFDFAQNCEDALDWAVDWIQRNPSNT